MDASTRIFLKLPLNRRIAWLLSLSLSMAVLLHFLYPAPPVVSHDTYRQIRRGMTEREIEYLLGAPTGNYGGYLWDGSGPTLEESWGPDRKHWKGWTTGDGKIGIHFDEQGRASGKSFTRTWMGTQEETFLDPPRRDLFRWLHRP